MPSQPNQNSEDFKYLLSYAYKILGLKPYLSGSLALKLQRQVLKLKLSLVKDDINKIIAEIKSKGYLDDSYLVCKYIQRNLEKGWGPRIIRLKLKNLGADPQEIDLQLSEYENNGAIVEYANIYSTKKNLYSQPGGYAKLLNRGFLPHHTKLVFDAGDMSE